MKLNWIRVMGLGLTCLLVNSCGSDISPSEVTGIWTPSVNSASMIKGPATPHEIRLNADGTFTMKGIPDALIEPPDLAKGSLISASGRWSMNSNSPNKISMAFAMVNEAPKKIFSNLGVIRSGDRWLLAFDLEGIDKFARFELERSGGDSEK